jgi:hypothetical protein
MVGTLMICASVALCAWVVRRVIAFVNWESEA